MSAILDIILKYETGKIVQVKSQTVGIIFRLIQLLIVCYVIFYVIIHEKGYQTEGPATGVVSTKVKGIAYPKGTEDPLYRRIWDVADYVYPPAAETSFTIITNAVISPGQTQSPCAEDPEVGTPCDCEEKECPDQCQPGVLSNRRGNGVNTGNCIPSATDKSVKMCEIQGWCPVEIDKLPTKKALIQDVVNFTVFIRSSVQFPKFDFEKRNLHDPDKLGDCSFDDEENLYCPIFRIGDILNRAGVPFDEISIDGGIIGISIDWDCNLDLHGSKCDPKYSFMRLDDPKSGGNNFRFANHYSQDGVQYRDLIKAYAIRFDIIVTGTGRRFDLVILVNNIAAGLALLAVATIVCDFLILNVLNKKEFYKENKYHVVREDQFDDNIAGYGAMDETPNPNADPKTE